MTKVAKAPPLSHLRATHLRKNKSHRRWASETGAHFVKRVARLSVDEAVPHGTNKRRTLLDLKMSHGMMTIIKIKGDVMLIEIESL